MRISRADYNMARLKGECASAIKKLEGGQTGADVKINEIDKIILNIRDVPYFTWVIPIVGLTILGILPRIVPVIIMGIVILLLETYPQLRGIKVL